jgi:Tat protein translocase TatB subunit
MELFGMGSLEVVLVLIVALMAVGPGKLPQFARNLNKGIRAVRKAASEATAELTKELEDEETEEKQPPGQKAKKNDSTKAAEHDPSDNTR